MAKFGVGTYTTKAGQVVKHADLPPEVQDAIEQMAAHREALGKPSAGGEVPIGGSPTDTQMAHARIKRLYDPATRDVEMGHIHAERIAHTLTGRLALRK